ncbi:hypothetical protein [Croceicoccus sp. YJ47]|nr:hypothetical protein [Croceicoccus sp. YJ47]QQN73263.1 hypothetical protein JD971_10415 [Croceicoccus sp. YJ47]
MFKPSFRSSAPDKWTQPRPFSDPSLRFAKFGAIQPMEEPGFWERLFRTH